MSGSGAEGSDAMDDEFDTMPRWTVEAIESLGAAHAIPAACRGSGNPAALTWLADMMNLGETTTLVDVGAGTGGAAEYAALTRGTSVLLVEPMLGACRAATRLFGRATVAASGTDLPLADGGADAVWSLGVLCSSADQLRMLEEMRRVTRPGGAVGLLVYIKTVADLPEQPDGNDFPTRDELLDLVHRAGLRVGAVADLPDFDGPPQIWQQQVQAVDDLVAREHRDDRRWQTADTQQSTMGHLIGDGLVLGMLLSLTP
ncbi:class I SAM-dependent methyltransferase [Williamsia soli]|uniref:class I SAM-dependent methyltransferase n=1 Tax=Williamsia soli TaxID=364929 RepID=UPI001A9DA8C3|nr:class I SAM-dependent methyltransferase [Williamsia soli]